MAVDRTAIETLLNYMDRGGDGGNQYYGNFSFDTEEEDLIVKALEYYRDNG